MSSKINQDFKIGWEFTVLAVTRTHALVFLEDVCKKEWVSYEHDNDGNLFSGFYTKDRKAAVAHYQRRSGVLL